jgi:CheY-like chemotaxis protein
METLGRGWRRACSSHYASGVRVLVAEDVSVNQELISLFLEPIGCDLTIVSNGKAAVKAVQAAAFDVVLMDMQMPVLDGLEATRRIRALGGYGATLPIIALTGNVLPEQIARCREAGMDDHVSKPFTAQSLMEVVLLWSDPARASVEGPYHPQIRDMLTRFGPQRMRSLLGKLDDVLSQFLDLGDRDAKSLENVAHGLCGAAAMLGFVSVGRSAGALDAALRSGEPAGSLLGQARHDAAEAREMITLLASRLNPAAA